MPSNTRKQLEAWLKKRDIIGSVADVGGLFLPIKGRTGKWEVNRYKIIDKQGFRNGITADYKENLSVPFDIKEQFEHVFCIEVMSHVWNPVQALKNLNNLTEVGGKLYISFHTIFPHHSQGDCLRYTKFGIEKLLEEAGFFISEIVAKKSAAEKELIHFCHTESKVVNCEGDIGYFVKAVKHGF